MVSQVGTGRDRRADKVVTGKERRVGRDGERKGQ